MIFDKIKHTSKNLPSKKPYLEFISAFLTIPVLITVIVLNLHNLSGQDKVSPKNPPVTVTQEPSKPVGQQGGQISLTPSPSGQVTPSPIPSECKKEIGPVQITSPQENQVVSNDPLPITISRQSSGYCAVVWSYRINNSAWSEYTDKSLYLYNLNSGQKKLELRIKSVVSEDEIVLTRTFTYQNPNATPTSVATSSATTQ